MVTDVPSKKFHIVGRMQKGAKKNGGKFTNANFPREKREKWKSNNGSLECGGNSSQPGERTGGRNEKVELSKNPRTNITI